MRVPRMWMFSSLFVLLWPMAYAKPLLALQQSLMMHSGTPTDSVPDDCSLDAQKRYRQSIELRARHLQRMSHTQERKLNDLYVELMGSDRIGMEGSDGTSSFDAMEAALKKRQAELDWLLETTEAAISRKRAAVAIGTESPSAQSTVPDVKSSCIAEV
ncbi:unnamed protein product [Symbiodinium sp. CCMP2592]|nr:unnamed protein product [Symbiodinium sp. CCMP2592]